MIQRCAYLGLALAALSAPALGQDASRTAGVLPGYVPPQALYPLRRQPVADEPAWRPLPRPHRRVAKPVPAVLPPSRIAALGPEPEAVIETPSSQTATTPQVAPAPPQSAALADTPAVAAADPLLGVRRPAFRPVLDVLPPRRLASLGSGLDIAEPVAAAPPPAQQPAVADAPAAESPEPDVRGRRGRHRDRVASASAHPELDTLIARHARANNIPESMVHRIVVRESRYNPRAVGRGGAMGLMQIKHATARALGYAGPPAGLLDADTNLRYAVPYLAGAYRTAGGDPDRAVGYYARGYYYAAKRQRVARGKPSELQPEDTDGLTQAQRAAQARPSIFKILLGEAKPVDPNTLSGRRE